ncbi:MAG: hypothetical protein AB7T32_19680, partial [Dehalococcoidia bacterium]
VLVHRIHGGDASFTAVHNLSGMPQDVTLPNDRDTASIIERGATLSLTPDATSLHLEPYGFVWLA